MNKKERAEFDAAILRANTLAALRWTAPVTKDLPVPDGGGTTTGYDYNTHACTVTGFWSESTAHGDGVKRSGSASQNGKALFSTRLLALRALRHDFESVAAEKLRKIDGDIERELGSNAELSTPQGVTRTPG